MSSTTEIHFEHYFLVALPWGRRHTVEVPISNPVPGEFNTLSDGGGERIDTELCPGFISVLYLRGSGSRGVSTPLNTPIRSQYIFLSNRLSS